MNSWTRREWLAMGVGAAVPERVEYRHYSRGLPEYLRSLADAARGRRDAEMRKLTSKAAIEARQQWTRDTFWKLSGTVPERTPLKVRMLGGVDREGYRLEKLIYQSRPDLVITANLYRPTGKGPFPGVLFQMGHAENGKAAVPYQKCCQGLARLGYMVLGFDPIGQGERLIYSPAEDPDSQHTIAGRQMLLVGESATAAMTWDAMRSLDVLAELPDVDPTRLASTGNSGGGTLTMFLACADSRLAAAAVACGNTENFACADFNPPGSTDDAEQDFVGSGTVGFDRWDLLYPLAPKPLLMVCSGRDFFGTYSSNYIANGRSEFARLQAVYAKLGHKDRIAWGETPLPHSLSYGLRVSIYNWFERWLKGSDRKITEEPPVHPEQDATLQCGPSGNVARDFASRSPVSFARALVKKQPGVTAAALVGLQASSKGQARSLGRVPSEGVDVEAIEVATDPGVYVPAFVYTKRPRGSGETAVLLLDARGRNAGAAEGGAHTQLAAAGLIVCAADLRGIGDAEPEMGRVHPRYAKTHAVEEAYAWASLILGRPLLAQRVADILSLVAALAERSPRVLIAANERLAVPALLATAIDGRVTRLLAAGGLESYRGILEAETYKSPLSNFLPGVLLKTDLEDIAASIAPRRLVRKGADAWTTETIRDFALS